MFGRRPAPQREKSLGSGFIISAEGIILTNAYVVEGAEEIKVHLADQRVFPGEVVGFDSKTDVAVLRIRSDQPLPVAVLGDSDRIRVGQWALAIGNPFGLDSTLTVGVVSATGRANVGIEDYEDFIQTDASINPGNSGGPLLNISAFCLPPLLHRHHPQRAQQPHPRAPAHVNDGSVSVVLAGVSPTEW